MALSSLLMVKQDLVMRGKVGSTFLAEVLVDPPLANMNHSSFQKERK